MLARSEGIITTLEEMNEWMGSPPAEEDNAFPVLMELDGLSKLSNAGQLALGQQWTSAHLYYDAGLSTEKLRAALIEAAPILNLAETASEKKLIWFDGDWALGQGRLLRYWSPVRKAANALLLRAEVARREGRLHQASTDVRRVIKLSDLALSIRDGSGLGLGVYLREDAETKLIQWAMEDRPDSMWVKELELTLRSQSIPDPAFALRPHLYDWLTTMDQLQTPEGRRRIGVLPTNGCTIWQGNWDELQSLNEGKLKMVQAFRAMWQDTSVTLKQGLDRTEEHEALFIKGAQCDPFAATPFRMADMLPTWPHQKIARLHSRRPLLQAVCRVLRSPVRNGKVSLAGLAHPFDGSKVAVELETDGSQGDPSHQRSFLCFGYEGYGTWFRVRVPNR